jgi:hypothetical protein
MLTGVSRDVLQVFANVGLLELVGARNVFREESDIWASTIEALQKSYELLGSQRCLECQHPFSVKNQGVLHDLVEARGRTNRLSVQ